MNKIIAFTLIIAVLVAGCTIQDTTNSDNYDNQMSESDVNSAIDSVGTTLIDDTNDVEIGSLI